MVSICSANLDYQGCFDYCLKNPTQCEQILQNFCFTNSAKILTNENCNLLTQNLISTRISPNLDNIITNFCRNSLNVTGDNLENYTQGQDVEYDNKVKNLCACHLTPDIYTNYYNSLLEKYPSIGDKKIDPKCLFTPCGYGNSFKSSDLKTDNFGTICPAVNCVNLIKITGSGTIDSLNILQNGACFNYVSEIKNCNNTTDCPTGQSCINNVCNSPENIGVNCIRNADCLEGNKCYKNLCKPLNYCEGNIDCGIEQKCYKNTCSPLDICEKDDDCFLNYKCNNGKCINPDENRNKTIVIPVGISVIIFLLVVIIASVFLLK
jgi:hypothetical protein